MNLKYKMVFLNAEYLENIDICVFMIDIEMM